MKKNPSQEQLSKSVERRIRHLMIRTLEGFEDSFADLEDTREGQSFKAHIRNMFNDAIRAQRDEIRDYSVDYRPLRLTDDNTLAVTQTFMQSVQRIDMDTEQETPRIRIYADPDNARVIDALRSEFDAGATYMQDGVLVLEIVGVETCVNSVLPIMDRYRLHASVRSQYEDWREQVVKLYRR